jgi:ElaB/YqjD/DUF883 family membrane-anchored ribosome-binding protein
MATTQDPLATTQGGSNTGLGNGSSMKDRVTGAASQLRESAGQYGRTAVEQIDRNVHNAATALHSTADKLRTQVPTDNRMSGIAQTAATKLDSTADMLDNFDTRELVHQMEGWTRKNPGVAIGGAMALGFFIGMTMRRDNHYD